MTDSAPLPPRATESAQAIPAEAAKVLEKKLEEVPPQEMVAQIFAAISRTTTIGPDPETAKIMAQAEMHAESSKLEAYKKSLENRDKQNERDHEFRCNKLKHDNFNLKVILGAAVLGCIGGIALLLTGRQLIGSNILIASAIAVFNLIGGKSPFSSKE